MFSSHEITSKVCYFDSHYCQSFYNFFNFHVLIFIPVEGVELAGACAVILRMRPLQAAGRNSF